MEDNVLTGFRVLFTLGSVAPSILGVWLAARFWDKFGWKSLCAWYAVRLAASWYWQEVVGRTLHYDLVGWVMHGQWIRDGARAGIDFHTPYSIGFNWLLGRVISICDSDTSLVFLFAIAEFLALVVFYFAIRRGWCEKIAKQTVLIYVTSPVYFAISWSEAQDEPLCMLGVALALWCAVRLRGLGVAFVSVTTLFFTKILAVFYLAPFFLRRSWKSAVVAVSLVAGYLAVALSMGINPFDLVFGRELGMAADSGEMVLDFPMIGSVWAVMSNRIPLGVCGAICLAALSAVGVAFAPAFVGRAALSDDDVRVRLCICWGIAWLLVFNLLYTMTFETYLLPLAVPVILFVMDRRPGLERIFAAAAFMVWLFMKIQEGYVRYLVIVNSVDLVTGRGIIVLNGVLTVASACVCLGVVVHAVRPVLVGVWRKLLERGDASR